MKRYLIHHGFALKSGNLLMPKTRYSTEDEDEQKQLAEFAKDGACEEIVPKAKDDVKAEESKVSKKPDEDLTVIPGVGKALEEKLKKAGIFTVSQLKAALEDESKLTMMNGLLGLQYEKVVKHFRAE